VITSLPGPLSIPGALALDLAAHILDSDVDIAISHRLQVDHGCTQTLEELTGGIDRYPVIPIVINSVAPPFALIAASAASAKRSDAFLPRSTSAC
jgi:2,3-dihydroxyphenylpropionate 1,2-dioxygenase